MKKTKIICTLGPACEKVAILKKMIRSGMNCARLNFSHGTYENMELLIKNVRQAAKECGRPVAIMQDLQGPKIRVGSLPEAGIELKKGQKVILSTSVLFHGQGTIPIQYKKLPSDVNKNDQILMDDGLIELKVLHTNKKNRIECTVIHGGLLKSHKGINVPTALISAPPLTAKDKKDLLFGLKFDLDYIALSFVKSAADINSLKKILEKHNSQAKIIAKIERSEALENLEEITKAADALMVARGDLGVEIAPEKVPLAQKEIVRLANIYGKSAIIATQMLLSMIENPRATRAEISDAATAIFDHADAFMLSNETSVGKYPVEAVHTLASVARTIEQEIKSRRHLLPASLRKEDVPLLNATCLSACQIGYDIQADHIIIITKNGQTAAEIVKHRPYIPITTITNNAKLVSQLQLFWGINKVILEKNLLAGQHVQTEKIISLLLNKKAIKKGEELVIVNIQGRNHIIRTIIA